jgi:hypothetical protein
VIGGAASLSNVRLNRWWDGIPLQEAPLVRRLPGAHPGNPIITARSRRKCAYSLLAVARVARNVHKPSLDETFLQGDDY